jgi:hypothetical protein
VLNLQDIDPNAMRQIKAAITEKGHSFASKKLEALGLKLLLILL